MNMTRYELWTVDGVYVGQSKTRANAEARIRTWRANPAKYAGLQAVEIREVRK